MFYTLIAQKLFDIWSSIESVMLYQTMKFLYGDLILYFDAKLC